VRNNSRGDRVAGMEHAHTAPDKLAEQHNRTGTHADLWSIKSFNSFAAVDKDSRRRGAAKGSRRGSPQWILDRRFR